MEGSIGAVVLAAGRSSRMGAPKALLPFGEGVVIDRVLCTLREGGVQHIVVVTGCGGAQIAAHLRGQPVAVAENARYQEGMFSSVLTGVRALGACEAFFLLPVDCPLVPPGVLAAMVAAYRSGNRPVVYPTYCGKKGHPPLIGHACIPAILTHSGKDGLKGALEPFARDALYLPVEDAAVLTDMDTPADYARDLTILQGAHRPRLLFLQGDIGIGKSTLLMEALTPCHKRTGGFYVRRRLEKGRCTGFYLSSVQEEFLPRREVSQKQGLLFMVREGGVWRFEPKVFEGWAADLLEREAAAGLPLFLLDEIGGMELGCPRFHAALYRLLEGGAACTGVYKQASNGAAQKEAMDTGGGYDRNRKLLVQHIAQLGGRILTLNMHNRPQVRARLEEFVSHVAGTI